MTTFHPASARGASRTDWLDSRHSFSFAGFHDPARMGFGPLRVINDDRVGPGAGFGAHGHRDMEIITYVISGALEHQDSLGHQMVLKAGEVQRMTAGTGIVHAEYNASRTEPVHFLQIWIMPDRQGHTPGHEQMPLPGPVVGQPFVPFAGPVPAADQLLIHQQAVLSVGRLAAGEAADLPLDLGQRGWLQVVRGTLRLGDQSLAAGDGVAMEAYDGRLLTSDGLSEVILFAL